MNYRQFASLASIALAVATIDAAPPDLILHHGKIVTVDKQFSVHEAIAIQGNKISQVGSNEAVLALQGSSTKLVDLHGKSVLFGLIDSHTHPISAAMHEFDHFILEMEII